MRLLSLLIALSALAAPAALAQFEVGVASSKTRFLLLEPVVLDCVVRNTGAEKVVLGEAASNAVVRVLLRGPDGEPVRRLEGALLEETIPLGPDQRASFQIPLSRSFELKRAGLHTVQLQIAYGGFTHTSEKASLDIARGQELARVVGRQPPRIFQLLTLNQADGTHLYARVDAADGQTCELVWDIDRYLAGPPVAKLFDRAGNLHILHQSAPYVFTHSAISADGDGMFAKRYKQEFSDTVLTLGADGQVSVQGGTPLP